MWGMLDFLPVRTFRSIEECFSWELRSFDLRGGSDGFANPDAGSQSGIPSLFMIFFSI